LPISAGNVAFLWKIPKTTFQEGILGKGGREVHLQVLSYPMPKQLKITG